jgi:hypothetical protein
LLTLFTIITGLAGIISLFLPFKKQQATLGYMVLVLVLGIYLPSNLTRLNLKRDILINKTFYCYQRNMKKKETQKSADYLREYKNVVQETLNNNQKLNIQRKIDYLDSMQISFRLNHPFFSAVSMRYKINEHKAITTSVINEPFD